MLSKLRVIPEILKTVTDNVSHYEAMKKEDCYIVWAEDSEGDSVEADDGKVNQSIQGTIDYFTKKDMDENVDKIQEALSAARISFYLNSVQYESVYEGNSDYIHYEWVFEVA